MRKIKLMSVIVLLSGTFACTNNPNNTEIDNTEIDNTVIHKKANKKEGDYQESYRFRADKDELITSLKEVLAPLSTRTEKGVLTLVISGPTISDAEEQRILDDVKKNLMIDVFLQTTEQQQDFYQVELAVYLSADTCRFEQGKVALSESACLLKRNQYLQLVNHNTWQQGLQYINNDSALATGAIKRLYENRIKIADKQTVTGD